MPVLSVQTTRRRWTSRLSPCPRSLLTGSRNAFGVFVRARRTSWWKCLRSYRTLLYSSGMSSRPLAFQFLMIVVAGAVEEAFKFSPKNRCNSVSWSRIRRHSSSSRSWRVGWWRSSKFLPGTQGSTAVFGADLVDNPVPHGRVGGRGLLSPRTGFSSLFISLWSCR